MRQSQKTALSFIVAVMLFSVFSFLAFSGFFSVLEEQFYSRSKIAEIEKRIANVRKSISDYHTGKLNELDRLIGQNGFYNVFRTNQAQEDIKNRESTIGKYREIETSFIRLRIYDVDLKKIHYSSDTNDIKQRFELSIVYFNSDELKNKERLDSGKRNLELSTFYFEEQSQKIVYIIPVRIAAEKIEGYACFSISSASLERFLQKKDHIKISERLLLSDTGLAVISDDGMNVNGVLPEIARMKKTYLERQTLYLENDSGIRYVLIGTEGSENETAFLVLESILLLNPVLKIILLFSFFLTCFLLMFFILNARQDTEIILAERLKRIRLYFLQELGGAGSLPERQKIQSGLSGRKNELKNSLTRGIKFRNPELKQLAESSIDSVFEDLLGFSDGTIQNEEQSALMIERVEKTLERILEKFRSIPEKTQSNNDRIAEDLPVYRSRTANDHSIEEVLDAEPLDEDEIEEAQPVLDEVPEGEDIGESALDVEPADDKPENDFDDVEELEEVSEVETSNTNGSGFTLFEQIVEELESLEIPENDDVQDADGVPFREPVYGEDDLEELESVEDGGGEILQPDTCVQEGNAEESGMMVPEIQEEKKQDFHSSGLPEIQLDRIEGIESIEIVAESEDGHFSLQVNLTELEIPHTEIEEQSASLTEERTKPEVDANSIQLRAESGTLEELVCVDDQESEPFDVEDLNEDYGTEESDVIEDLPYQDEQIAEELEGIDEEAAELEPIGMAARQTIGSVFWSIGKTYAVPVSDYEHNTSGRKKETIKNLLNTGRISRIGMNLIHTAAERDDAIVFANGTFQISTAVYERQSVFNKDKEILDLVEEITGAGENTPLGGSQARNAVLTHEPEIGNTGSDDINSIREILEAELCVGIRFTEGPEAAVLTGVSGNIAIETLDVGHIASLRESMNDETVIFGRVPDNGIEELSFIHMPENDTVKSLCIFPYGSGPGEYMFCFFSADLVNEEEVILNLSKLTK